MPAPAPWPKPSLVLSGCSSLKILDAKGVLPSPLQDLMLEDCTSITELPEALGQKFGRSLGLINLHGCEKLDKLPQWVVAMEQRGSGVRRPHHLA